MKLLCPKCLGALVSSDGVAARCEVHGGEFKILFNRYPQEAMDNPPPIPPVENKVESSALTGGRPGMRCVQHPTIVVTQQCHSCGSYMCPTCDFTLPNGMHLCPSCATKPQTSLGPKRKRSMIWSFVCAGGATLGLAVSLGVAATRTDHSEAANQMLGSLMSLFVLVPSIVGLGLGLGAIDRRYVNPPSLWAAAIWNGVLLGGMLLLCIVGLMN